MTSGGRCGWNRTLPGRSAWTSCERAVKAATRCRTRLFDPTAGRQQQLAPRDSVRNRPPVHSTEQERRLRFLVDAVVELDADSKDVQPPSGLMGPGAGNATPSTPRRIRTRPVTAGVGTHGSHTARRGGSAGR